MTDQAAKFSRYGFSLIFAVLTVVLAHWLLPIIKTAPFDLFLGAVVVSSCYGGLGPGLLTAFISILALNYYFLPPINSFTLYITDILRLSIFGSVAILSSSISSRLKEAKAALQKTNDELEARVEQRTADLSHANVQLEEEVRQRLAAEKEILQSSSREQQRLGEDLHDGLSQILAGLRLMTQNVRRKLQSDGSQLSEDVVRIESGLGEALSQTEVLARGLYPVELETNGLMAALQELANKIAVVYRIDCRFKYSSPVLIEDSSTANHLFRIAQEAVMNSIKNGKAKRISIRLSHRGAQTALSVTDDGIGLQPGNPRQGMGLKMMAYRARVINADLVVRSRTKGFTRAVCSFHPEITGEKNYENQRQQSARQI